MKILHITTSTSGGAGIACVRLHQGLLQEKVHSEVLALKDYAGMRHRIPGIRTFARDAISESIRKGKFLLQERRARQQLRNQPPGFELFSLNDSLFDITRHLAYRSADLVNLHWVSGFADFSSFFKKNKKPLVWTLHDMFPFTGGCHHADGWNGFETDCSYCPQLAGTANPSLAAQQLQQKKEALAGVKKLHIVTPSQWLGNLSARSALFRNYPHQVIINGAPTDIFYGGSPQYARLQLDLPLDKNIILFVAQSLSNRRKGMHLLLEALKKINTSNLLLVSAGKEDAFNSPVPVVNLGNIHSPEKMSLVYQAADVFVLPSLAENLPNTIAEALLCGSPVIAFRQGGIPEMIAEEHNGYLCPVADADQLALAIDLYFANKDAFDRIEIAGQASKKYDMRLQARSYLNVYKQLLD